MRPNQNGCENQVSDSERRRLESLAAVNEEIAEQKRKDKEKARLLERAETAMKIAQQAAIGTGVHANELIPLAVAIFNAMK